MNCETTCSYYIVSSSVNRLNSPMEVIKKETEFERTLRVEGKRMNTATSLLVVQQAVNRVLDFDRRDEKYQEDPIGDWKLQTSLGL